MPRVEQLLDLDAAHLAPSRSRRPRTRRASARRCRTGTCTCRRARARASLRGVCMSVPCCTLRHRPARVTPPSPRAAGTAAPPSPPPPSSCPTSPPPPPARRRDRAGTRSRCRRSSSRKPSQIQSTSGLITTLMLAIPACGSYAVEHDVQVLAERLVDVDLAGRRLVLVMAEGPLGRMHRRVRLAVARDVDGRRQHVLVAAPTMSVTPS